MDDCSGVNKIAIKDENVGRDALWVYLEAVIFKA